MEGEAWQQECGTTGHTVSITRKQGEVDIVVQFGFSVL